MSRHPLQHRAYFESARDIAESFDMVRVTMTRGDPVQTLDSTAPQIRGHGGLANADAVFDECLLIRFVASARIEADPPAAVEQHQRPLRKADQHRVSLTDIQEGDAQSPALVFMLEGMNDQQPTERDDCER